MTEQMAKCELWEATNQMAWFLTDKFTGGKRRMEKEPAD